MRFPLYKWSVFVSASLLPMTPGINSVRYLIIRQEGDNSMSLGS